MPKPKYEKEDECPEGEHHVRTAYLKNSIGTLKVDFCTKCDAIVNNYGYEGKPKTE